MTTTPASDPAAAVATAPTSAAFRLVAALALLGGLIPPAWMITFWLSDADIAVPIAGPEILILMLIVTLAPLLVVVILAGVSASRGPRVQFVCLALALLVGWAIPVWAYLDQSSGWR